MNNILILEDNQDFCKQLKNTLTKISIVNHIQTAYTISAAFSCIDLHKYSLFVVDIELPDGSGYDFIKKIRNMKQYQFTFIVVITGMRESAEEIINAYNIKGIHRYFQKPFSLEAFRIAVTDILSYRIVNATQERLSIKRRHINVFFEFRDIIYIETNNKETTVVCTQGPFKIGRYSLSKIHELLPQDRFLRIHRAYIVNQAHIVSLIKGSNHYFVTMQKIKEPLPIGVSYKEVLEFLD